MMVLTDNPRFANILLGVEAGWQEHGLDESTPLGALGVRLLQSKKGYLARVRFEGPWTYSVFVEKAAESQFDLLAEVSDDISESVLCCAGSGEGFHGLRGRSWAALPGNLHLSASFRPNRKFAMGGVCFTTLAVVAALETIEAIGVQDAKVKWVNDILIDEAKVGGVLVHIRTQGETVTSALVGIGLNVEAVPRVPPTVFVPKTAALKDFVPDPGMCRHGRVFRRLVSRLAENYKKCMRGRFSEILEFYRKRSVVIGRKVTVYEDDEIEPANEIASGRVSTIGENLELRLEGRDTPLWKGRLVLTKSDPG